MWAATLLLLLPVLGGTGAAHGAQPSSAVVVAVYQSNHTEAQSAFTVSMKVASTANINYTFFTFCQLGNGVCYQPVFMTYRGANWYSGTTNPMTSYPGMTPGILAGYNITIAFNDSTMVTEPAPPNSFGNLTIARTVTGVYEFEMSVFGTFFGVSGVVSNSSSHTGVAGATVSVTPANASPVQTDSSGAFSLQGLSNGTYTLTVSAPGYQGSSTTVQVAGQNTQKDLPIAPTNSGGPTPHPTKATWAGWFGTPTGILALVVGTVILVGLVATAVTMSRRRNRPPATPETAESLPPKSV